MIVIGAIGLNTPLIPDCSVNLIDWIGIGIVYCRLLLPAKDINTSCPHGGTVGRTQTSFAFAFAFSYLTLTGRYTKHLLRKNKNESHHILSSFHP